jgi:hypothetical protein
MGASIERRKDLRGKSRVESGLRWTKLTFGQMVKDKHSIFVVPDELNLKNNSIVPVEKVIITKEEFGEMMRGGSRDKKYRRRSSQHIFPS